MKVHDFGPVGDEDNWTTLDNPILELESLYSLLATVLPTSKLNASKSSLFPILEKSPDENPMNLIFIILTGPNAEETATSLYISLFYKTNKGKPAPLYLREKSVKRVFQNQIDVFRS